jgi:hypothetical protein
MDKVEKDALIKKLISTEDDAILNQVREILDISESDFWNNLNPKLKAGIERGIQQAQNGDLTFNSEVMKNIREKRRA